MKPFLVTTLQAARMPRWLLLALCALYVVPGLVGRDPWRGGDAEGFGIAWTMARAERGWLDVLVPSVIGEPVHSEGPLPFWLGAVAIRALPWLPADAVFQGVAMLWLAMLLACVWYATYMLARRPEVQPEDPFGASASRVDYGRAIADCAVLVTIATFGLLAQMHETTAQAAQVAWVGVFLFGCAWALDRPRLGGLTAGVAVGFTTLTAGIPLAAALAATALALVALALPFRLVALPFLTRALPTALVVSLAWPLALAAAGGAAAAHLDGWLHWNGSLLAGPSPPALAWHARTIPWFFWPAWPIAAWAAWRWRGRRREPSLAVPGLTAAFLLALALLSPRADEAGLLAAAPPLAMLAAFGLPTIRRGVISLIDWFAVMTFSTIGLVLWAYWIAFQTGWPARMAFRIRNSVLGFEPLLEPVVLALGVLVTVAWLALVRWRVSRQPQALWRTMALSSGGMVLAWALLMTLWLPAANHRRTYREPAVQAGAVLAGDRCVRPLGLDGAQRVSFAYFGAMRFDDGSRDCRWLLVADDLRRPFDTTRLPGDWALEWRGQRPTDRLVRFRLLRRVGD